MGTKFLMKNKIAVIAISFFTIFLSLILGLGSGNSFVSAEMLTNGINSNYYSNVHKSIGVYNETIGKYIVNGNEQNSGDIIKYDSNYAGSFIDENGLLHINLVNLDGVKSSYIR